MAVHNLAGLVQHGDHIRVDEAPTLVAFVRDAYAKLTYASVQERSKENATRAKVRRALCINHVHRACMT